MEGVEIAMSEIWRPIPGYEGFYWVSNMARVKNSYGKILSRVDCGNGVLKVKLQANGQREEKYISSLMVEVYPEYYKGGTNEN